MSNLRDAYEETSREMTDLDGLCAALDMAWDAVTGLDHRTPEVSAMGALVRATCAAAKRVDEVHQAEFKAILAAEEHGAKSAA